MLEINSLDNKTIKLVKKLLSDKKYRDDTNLFVAETEKVVSTLIKNGLFCQNILVAQESNFLPKFRGENAIKISTKVYNSLSALKNGDGVIGVFRKPKIELKIQKDSKYLVLNKIQDSNNLGNVIRTANAFDIDGIFLTNDSVDLFNPSLVRNSMGNLFNVPIKFSTSYSDVISSLKSAGIKVYATALNSSATELSQANLSKGIAVVFGNEGNGLSEKEIKMCDETIYIKMNDKVQSLNLSSAASIVMYKMSQNETN